MRYLPINRIEHALKTFKQAPFDHFVLDDFFPTDIAKILESEFPAYHSPKWFTYLNAIENKKALNDWNVFPRMTYEVFSQLSSPDFAAFLSSQSKRKIFSDPGLHGGGWHIHGPNGNLNPHLDYSIHPKLKLQRKFNLIVYLSQDLNEEHGGHLGLWNATNEGKAPGTLAMEIRPRFNRAVFFDTTQNSWHGMSRPFWPDPLVPTRKSIAVYYLCSPEGLVDKRERALFAPRENQKGDTTVEELCRVRADLEGSEKVYRT